MFDKGIIDQGDVVLRHGGLDSANNDNTFSRK
jgi:hypothetical protein